MTEKNFSTVGEHIAYLRNQNAYTQEELGNLLGVTKLTINRWENNIVNPRPQHRRKLSLIFKIDVKDL